MEKKTGKIQYILLLPIFIFYLLFFVWPLVEVIRISLSKTNFMVSEWVGFSNYVRSFSDPVYLTAVKNNLLYMVIIVPGVLAVVIGISMFVFTMAKRWHDVTRFVSYIPVISAGIIIAQVWKWIYHPEGPVNHFLNTIGFDTVSFFTKSVIGIPAISIIMIYQMFGGSVIILMSNMLSIDKSLFDAAMIDGASWKQIKLKIILPMMSKTIGMITLLVMISSMQIVETIMALAPYEHTASITYHIYREGFLFSRHGLASSQAIILLIITVIMTLTKNRITKEK